MGEREAEWVTITQASVQGANGSTMDPPQCDKPRRDALTARVFVGDFGFSRSARSGDMSMESGMVGSAPLSSIVRISGTHSVRAAKKNAVRPSENDVTLTLACCRSSSSTPASDAARQA